MNEPEGLAARLTDVAHRYGAISALAGVTLDLPAEIVVGLIGPDGVGKSYGARPLKRVVQAKLQNPLALEVLEGRFGEGDTIRVGTEGGNCDSDDAPALFRSGGTYYYCGI